VVNCAVRGLHPAGVEAGSFVTRSGPPSAMMIDDCDVEECPRNRSHPTVFKNLAAGLRGRQRGRRPVQVWSKLAGARNDWLEDALGEPVSVAGSYASSRGAAKLRAPAGGPPGARSCAGWIFRQRLGRRPRCNVGGKAGATSHVGDIEKRTDAVRHEDLAIRRSRTPCRRLTRT